jgi:hypothetical protein
MKQTAENIVAIMADYHHYTGFQFTAEHVLNWASQFAEADREFILNELLHLLQQGIYVSELQGRKWLLERIENLTRVHKFANPVQFLANTEFIISQPADKSQGILLALLNEELQKKYGVGIAQSGTVSKKYALYIDDVIATGGTVFKDCLTWLQTAVQAAETNLDMVLKNEKVLIVSVFCMHNWANVKWRLRLELGTEAILKKIQFLCNHEIQDHRTFLNQQLNFAYPHISQPQSVINYFTALAAYKHEKFAFRIESIPQNETLFSSAENRIRFENILLQKGVELLQSAETLKPNHRPLGATFPSYKTLGTGTLFFT